MTLKEIISDLEKWAPLSYQEEWDNSGLILGDPSMEVNGILISLDTTHEVLLEAIEHRCNLIISHHPLIFKGIKHLTPAMPEYRIIHTAIRSDIAILALHTNLDNRAGSLNEYLGRSLGMVDMRILEPKRGFLKKLVTFCPVAHAGRVRDSLFSAGAGHIGRYDCCSFNTPGSGTFRASADANPFVGEKNTLHVEEEIRVEVVFAAHQQHGIVQALLKAHPYEEVAYDIYSLDNGFPLAGSGIHGRFPEPVTPDRFLSMVKQTFGLDHLRHTKFSGETIQSIAICSGAGAFLIPNLRPKQVDAYLTGDLKYHDFQGAPDGLLLADIGHFESEQFVKEMLKEVLIEKFPNFAVLISARETNPIKYF